MLVPREIMTSGARVDNCRMSILDLSLVLESALCVDSVTRYFVCS